MKKLVLALLLLSQYSFAALTDEGEVVMDRVSVECEGHRGSLNFELNRSTYVAVFSNTQALGAAQLPAKEPIAFAIDGKKITVVYNWYFTADYELVFAKNIVALKAGDRVWLTLSGDDSDGSFFSDEPFNCSVK